MTEQTNGGKRRQHWEFAAPGKIVFGRQAVRSLGRILKRFSARRALLVTDPVLSKLGLTQRVVQQIECLSIELQVFDGGRPEPSTDLCQQVARQAQSWRPDVWIALGGGSNMDLAKLASTLATYPADPTTYFGFDKVPGPLPPLICVPTTAGTGSEVSHAAVIKVAQTGQKGGIVSDYLRPAAACVDPSFSDSCPAQLTAESGFDALTHAIEAFLAAPFEQLPEDDDHGLPYQGSHPLGAGFAEQAIRLIGKGLPVVLREPANCQGRDQMALAATLAGLAFSSCGVAVVHALEYWIGSKYGCAHGAGNAVLLPSVLRFYLPEAATAIARIGYLLGADGLDEVDDVVQQAEVTIAHVERLRDQAGLPRRLRDVGAERSDLPALARAAGTLQHLVRLAPKRPSRKELLQILEDAF